MSGDRYVMSVMLLQGIRILDLEHFLVLVGTTTGLAPPPMHFLVQASAEAFAPLAPHLESLIHPFTVCVSPANATEAIITTNAKASSNKTTLRMSSLLRNKPTRTAFLWNCITTELERELHRMCRPARFNWNDPLPASRQFYLPFIALPVAGFGDGAGAIKMTSPLRV